MAHPTDSAAKIAEVNARIRAVEVKEARVEAALDGGEPYLGTTDRVRYGILVFSCGGLALDS